MTTKPEKLIPRAAIRIPAVEGAFRNGPWSGGVSAEALGTDAFCLFVRIEERGGGPQLHVHPYDEVFVVLEGHARYFVGEQVVEAWEGDVVMGPANVPHRFENAGDGVLRTIDIHLNSEWIQTDLDG